MARNCRRQVKKDTGSDTAMLTVLEAMISQDRRKLSDRWILDSGCTRHMSNKRESFTTFVEMTGTVFVGSNDVV